MVFGIDDSVLVGVAALGLTLVALLYVSRRATGKRKEALFGLALNRDGSGTIAKVRPDKWGIVRYDGGAYPLRPEHAIPLKGGLVRGRLLVLRKDVPAPLILTPPDPGAKPILSVKGVFEAVSPGYEYYHNPAYAPVESDNGDGDEGVPLTDDGLPLTESEGFLTPDWRSAYELEELIGERKLAEYHTSGEEPKATFYWWVTWGLLVAILGILGLTIFG